MSSVKRLPTLPLHNQGGFLLWIRKSIQRYVKESRAAELRSRLDMTRAVCQTREKSRSRIVHNKSDGERDKRETSSNIQGQSAGVGALYYQCLWTGSAGSWRSAWALTCSLLSLLRKMTPAWWYGTGHTVPEEVWLSLDHQTSSCRPGELLSWK